jgi:hypothetical protein
MIVQILGGLASEVYVNHLPKMFTDVALGMGEDLGVVFDDDKLKEICMTLQMPYPGDWGYKRLPNLVYGGMGPHFDTSGLRLLLKKEVLEPAVDEIGLDQVRVERMRPEPDAAAMDALDEDSVLLSMHTLFRNKDFGVRVGPDFEPSRLSLLVHDLQGVLGAGGPEIIGGVLYDGKPLEMFEGSGHEIDYEVKTIDPNTYTSV